MATVPESVAVFDRALVRRHRERAAPSVAAHDFLFREAAERLADRLDDTSRRFPLALDLGSRAGAFDAVRGGRGGIETLVQCDLAFAAAERLRPPRLVLDEEALPFAEGSLDLVVSVLALHWVNDLPGALVQLRRALKPDGLFLGAMLGGRTLGELRQCLADAEIAETGGLSPRVSPFADGRDCGGLLQRAGFALPVVDSDLLTVTYPDALALMRDLRGMGEANAVIERLRRPTRRAVLLRAAALYAERFAGDDGRIAASFEILTMTAWAPSPAQQQPLRPGSAATRLADALGAVERPAGERAPRG